VPVVNENDSVGVEELRFGDNDRLAAIVGHLAGAGMLLLLTDTAGLYSDDPRLTHDAELISAVKHTDEALDRVVSGLSGPMGSGGVASKVAAARIAAWSGIPTVIADSKEAGVVLAAVAGGDVGTWIDPHPSKLSARKLWIAFGQPAEGVFVVDDGAIRAITSAGKSLLAAGITAVEGEFSEGAAVEVVGPGRRLVAKGLTRLGSRHLGDMLGRHSSEVGGEVVHRDDLVVLTGVE
jgi:glutamate 5-kinase